MIHQTRIKLSQFIKGSVSVLTDTLIPHIGSTSYSFIVFFVCVMMSSLGNCLAQNKNLSNIYQLIENDRYDEAISNISTKENISFDNDTTKSELMYLKGVALYKLHKYEESIKCLTDGLYYTSTTCSESSCEYVENLYGIGSAYYHLEDYKNAESFFRKAIIAVRQLPYKCNIMSQVFSELAQCYVKQGHPELADLCIQEGESEVHSVYTMVDWKQDIENMYDLIDSYMANSQIEKAESIFKKILETIETNIGVLNEDYILYGYLFGHFYQELYDGTNPDVLYEANRWYNKVLESAKQFNNQIDSIYGIYTHYLTSLAWLNNEDDVKNLFREALDYYSKSKSAEETDNLYLRVGESFFSANNYNQCIAYLGKVLLNKINFRESENAAISMLLDCMYLTKDSRIMEFLAVSYPHMIGQLGKAKTNLRLYFEDAMFTYKQFNNSEKAIEAGNIALKLCNEEKQPRHLLTILNNLIGLTYLENQSLAESYISQAEKLLNNPELLETDVLSYISTKGFMYIKAEQYSKAINLLLDAVNAYPISSSNLPFMANLYHNLGRAYMLVSDYKNAYKSLSVAMDCQAKVYGNVSERTQKYLQECEPFVK